MSAEPTSPTPRCLGELPSLHLNRDEADGLVHLLTNIAAWLGFYEERAATSSSHARAEQLREVARELSRRANEGYRQAAQALPFEQHERLFEATWGERLDAYLTRTERERGERGEGGHER